jgi:glucose-6-phosphate 1-epimerase
MQSPQDLSAGFAIPNRITFQSGNGGLTKATLSSPASQAEVYLHGGHVTHFTPAGKKPVLFTSAQSLYQPDKPIRGGVPLIFPWFGPRQPDPIGNSPMHGFARLSEWTVELTRNDGQSTTLILRLEASKSTREFWPGEFVLRYQITITDKLSLEFSVQNVGAQPFTFEEALHTYLEVADARQISIDGLAGATFIDKVDQLARKVQNGPIQITGETDRVYLNTQSTCTVADAANRRRIIVSKESSDTTVVWNPWIAKAKAMADFGDEEWTKMVCIETCNVNIHAVKLDPGATHTMRAVIAAQSV